MILKRPGPLLYLITNRQNFRHHQSAEEPTTISEAETAYQLDAIESASRAGCDLIQVREKELGAKELARFTRRVIGVARPHGALVLVNDRLDVALACGADGVHLRTSSLATPEVRRVTKIKAGRQFLIGVSTHSIEEAVEAETGGADFIVCGPVFWTASKAAYGSPIGLQNLAAICLRASIPVIALGGVGWHNCHDPIAAGAAGIAGIELFRSTVDLAEKIRQYRELNGAGRDQPSSDPS